MADGLLDFIKTPEGQGLLGAVFAGAAGARRGAPINTLGIAGMGGLQSYIKATEQAPAAAWIKEMMGGGQQPQAMALGQNPTNENAAILASMPNQQRAGGFDVRRIDPNKLAMGALNPKTAPMAKALFDMQQGIVKGHEFDPTKDRVDINGNLISRGIKLPEGMMRGASGSEIDPNYLENIAKITSATEGAKAREGAKYNFIKPSDGFMLGGRPFVGTQAQASDMFNGGQSAPQATVMPRQGGKVTDEMLDSLRRVESSGNPNAVNPTSGAMGAYQFMPGTVAMLAKQGIKFDPFNEPQARGAARAYLTELVNQNGGDINKALAQYGGFKTKDPSAYIGNVLGGANNVQMGQQTTQAANVPAGLYARTPEEQAAAMAKVETEKQISIDQGKKIADLRLNAPKMLAVSQDAISVIDKALNHPGLESGTGLSATVDPRNYIPGQPAYDFRVVMDQIKGKAFLQAFETLKGGGQITEVEGRKATEAIARLNQSQSTKEFKTGLADLKKIIGDSMNRMNEQIGSPTSQQSLQQTSAPVRRYNPATGRIE